MHTVALAVNSSVHVLCYSIRCS